MRARPDTAPAAAQPRRGPRNPGRNWIDRLVQFITILITGAALLTAAGTPQPADNAGSPAVAYAVTHLGGR